MPKNPNQNNKQMKRLLQIELQKIWLNKASRILTLTYFILLSFIALIAAVKIDFGPIQLHLAEMGIFNFPYIWHFNTYVADFFKFFLAVVIVSMMANEYSYGTLKQNLIDGLSKKEFIQSKFLTVIAFALSSTVFVFLMSLILGFSFSSYTEIGIVFTDMQYILAYFVKLVGFFSLCLLLGILVKRSAFALGFLILIYMIEGILHLILRFILFTSSPQLVDNITSLFPLESMSNLILEPGSRLSAVKGVTAQLGMGDKDYDVHFFTILIVIIWTVIFMLMSYKLLKKRDL